MTAPNVPCRWERWRSWARQKPTAPGDLTCATKADNTVDCWGFIGNPHGGRSGSRLELEGISVGSGNITIDVRVVDYRLVQADSPGGDASAGTDTDDETTPEEDDTAQRCFDHHKFGAQPVDLAKSADRQTVLAQVSWGFHETIGCYLALDEAATAALRAANT